MSKRMKLLLGGLLIGAATLICGSLLLGFSMVDHLKMTVLPLLTRRNTRIYMEGTSSHQRSTKRRENFWGKTRRKENCYE